MREKPQMDLHRSLRRQSDRLACNGTAICLFGVWSNVKFILDVIQDRKNIPAVEGLPEWAAYLILIIVLVIMCTVIFSWYLFIGISARAVALKNKRHVVYAIVAAISALLIIVNDVSRILNFKDSYETVDVFIVSVIIDFSLVLSLFEITISNAKVRYLRRMIQKEEAAAHES